MAVNFNKTEYLASYGVSSQLPVSKSLEFVFSGRSNVGKSSMINKLFGRKDLARVSSVPGKTITINFYKADNIHFVDLPGYGYAKVAKSEKERFSKLIQKYFDDDRKIALIFQLIDMRHPPSKLDIDMINYLIEYEFPFVVVLTKADKLNKTEFNARLEKIKEEIPCGEQITVIPFSSKTGLGVENLREIINELCEE